MPARPPFDSLPLRTGDPLFSAWGLYGDDDQLGTLNLLTPENTLAAAKGEIQTGIRVALDPPLDALLAPSIGRRKLAQTIVRVGDNIPAHDDILEFNTQIGAQWDGLRHMTYHKSSLFYNNTPIDQISGDNANPDVLGIDAWVKRGSIAGRGVLLDYYAYSQHAKREYDLINCAHAITYQDLVDCAKYQGTELREGDLLFVRSGFWVGYGRLTEEEKTAWGAAAPRDCRAVGVEATRAMATWLWESGIAACAGDGPAWEKVPSWEWPASAGLEGLSLHEIMLGGWGMPIGELFDLETLSEVCKAHKRWSFFVTSAPLHVRGGVGSPPNCIAIF